MNPATDPDSPFPVGEIPSFFHDYDFFAAPDRSTAEIEIALPPSCAGRAEALPLAAFAMILARQVSRCELQISIAMEQRALAAVVPVPLELRPLRSVGDLLAALTRILAQSATQRAPDAAVRIACFECVANVGFSVTITHNADGQNRAHCSVAAREGAYFRGFSRILADRLPHVMQWLATHLQSPLSDCDTTPPSEHHSIARFSSGGSVTHASRDITLHGLFEAQARRVPDATAVIFEDVRWSYRQLDDMANRLAACLYSRFSVQRGQRIAVVAERSHLLIVALVGIIKADCCYCPIDPRQPIERVARMLDDVDPAVLIVDARNAVAASRYDRHIFVLDIELEQLDSAPESFASLGGPRSLAYTIFTSGSTGRPNAVAVEHCAIVNTIIWRNAYYGIDERDVNLQLPSFAFDSSVLDIFGFLSAGAALVIPEEARRLDADYIGALAEQHGVTRLIATPSYYRQLCGSLARSRRMHSVTVAGEATSTALVSMHFHTLPGVRLINEYGPTENAVCSAATDLHDGEHSVPIGKPVPNTSIHVLDPLLRPVGIGVPGEVYLAGAGLAREYFSQPRVTAARFLPCPFADGGARMYRSGDWAFWRPDGVLEFLGRRDRQVKIRGFRIELGDIEAVLGDFPNVTAVLVMAKDRAAAVPRATPERYLVAYLGVATPVALDQLKAFAAARLPAHMMPSLFCVLPGLPLTNNGKIDEASLRAREDFVPVEVSPLSHVTGFETEVLRACTASLHLASLDLDQNLFSAGATSLTVMQIVTALRRSGDFELNLADVYTHPTVRDLAAKLALRLQSTSKGLPS